MKNWKLLPKKSGRDKIARVCPKTVRITPFVTLARGKKMPSQRNINQLARLKDKLGRARSVVFADYAGLSVGQQTELRSKVAEAGGEFTVAKNTLLKLALEQILNTEYRILNKEQKESLAKHSEFSIQNSVFLQGPTAVLFSYQDEIMPLKVMVEFAKGAEKPTIKAGFLGNQELTAEQVAELAKLPGKQELIVQLLGRLQSPAYGLVNVLTGGIRKLVLVLRAIEEKK